MKKTEIKRRFIENTFGIDGSEYLKRKLVDNVMPLAEEKSKKVIEWIKNGSSEYIKKYWIKSKQEKFYIVFDGIFASKPVNEMDKYKEKISNKEGRVVREEEMLFDNEWKPYVWLTYYKAPKNELEVKFTVELECYRSAIREFMIERLQSDYRRKMEDVNLRPLDENLVVAFLEWRCGVSILALQGLWVDIF